MSDHDVDSGLQDEINRAVYEAPGVQHDYSSRFLTPAEAACLLKYQPRFFGRDVLDIGVGAGRTTGYLAPLARRYEAVDYSPVMVSYMKSAMPEISVRQENFRDLGVFDDEAFDFILATDNVIDALSHDDRLRALREAHRVLRSGGLLAFSAHNLRYRMALSGPRFQWSPNPGSFVLNVIDYVMSWRNYLRVAPLRTVTPEYALLNDAGHRFACLHYYAARSTVEAQLAGAGLRLIDVFDGGGRQVPATRDDRDSASLFYVAERVR